MSDPKDRPAREEADMLESLFRERQRQKELASTRVSGRKGIKRPNAQPGRNATGDKPAEPNATED